MPSTTEALKVLAVSLLENIDVVPGSKIVKDYVKRSYQNDPFRVALEALLFFFAVKYMTTKKYQPNDNDVKLTDKEIEELISEWKPEPLISEATEEELEAVRDLISLKGHKDNVAILADGSTLKDYSSVNFSGLHHSLQLKSKCAEVIKNYGVGTCGPSGFYGTMDIHLDLQSHLARLFQVESGIIYAQAYSAVASIIPAFSKKGDIIVADEAVNFAIQRGIQLSKSDVHYFKHNDMDDLERILKSIDEDRLRKKKRLTRRFIIVEGLYQNTGTISPLPDIIRLKYQYKYRLILDESLSFGAIGKKSLGVIDYHCQNAVDVDIITGSLSNTLGAAGGFCVGAKHITDHQVLSSAAYCYSASLPAFLAAAAIFNLDRLDKEGQDISAKLSKNIEQFRTDFNPCPYNMELKGSKDSPLIYLSFKTNARQNLKEERAGLKAILASVKQQGFLLSLYKFVGSDERTNLRPMIKVAISASSSPAEISAMAKALLRACTQAK